MTAPPPRPARTPLVRASIGLHLAAVPAVALAPSRWPWIAGALVANHCAILAGGLFPRSSLLGPNLRRSEAAAHDRGVVLTFDDGPDPEVTPRVLDVLEERRASATFFCIGERVARHADLVREIARRGHRVENHSYRHANLFFFHLPAALDREIVSCQEAIADATGRAPRFFRAPAGIRGPLVQGALARAGLRLASWTRRGFDTVARDPRTVAARLTRDLAAGDVLVLHDGARHPREGRARVVLEALPRVLDAVAGAGLRALPLTDGEAGPRG